jgi:(2Fe-2S) ferredoxin
MHEISQKLYKAYVLVCENRRDDGRRSCGVTEPGLRMALKDAVKAAGLPARVVSTSCIDHCNEGPTIMIVPMASSDVRLPTAHPLILGSVHIDDIREIVRKLNQMLRA